MKLRISLKRVLPARRAVKWGAGRPDGGRSMHDAECTMQNAQMQLTASHGCAVCRIVHFACALHGGGRSLRLPNARL